MSRRGRLALLLVVGAFLCPPAFGAATILIQNLDPAGIGFNDTTPVAPVGGNTGVTLGQQRLIAFQAAANKWGATLTSGVTIVIRAQWTALSCTASSAVLGSAGATEVFRDFAGALVPGHWYPKALTNEISGSDLDPAVADINANFNVNLGKPGCLTGISFYLGLDNNHGSNIDLVIVLEHEFAHGLGFQTFTNGSTGAQLAAFPSIWDDLLLDTTTGKTWTQMTAPERVTSAVNSGNLVWSGSNVVAAVPTVLAGGPIHTGADAANRALMYAPNPFQGGSSVSHYNTSAFPNQLMEPAINSDLTHEVSPPNDLTLPLLKDIGWTSSATSADLSITNVPSSGAITGGTNVTYTLVVANGGPDQADSVTVTYNLPSPLSFVSCIATNGGVCGGSGSNRTVTYGSIASAASSTITMVAALPCSSADGSVVSGTANVASASTPDPVPSNNSATAVFTVKGALPAPVITTLPDAGAGSPNRAASAKNSAGSTYAWTIGNGTITSGQGTSQITFTAGSAGTTLTLSVVETNSLGCQSAAGTANVNVLSADSALQFYTVTPCRVLDTRAGSGFPAGYGPPSIAGGAQRTFVLAGQCGLPAGARAVSINAAVWIPQTRGDLRIFPAGVTAPLASTLNWEPNILALANAAVVPLSGAGAITVLVDGSGTVDIFFDVNGYFQ